MSTTDSRPVVIIFGAGPNIGTATATKFRNAGYRVAAVSRTAQNGQAGVDFHVEANLSDPRAIPTVFSRVRDHFGGATPKVVVWNAAHLSPSPDKGNIFSVPVGEVERDLAVAVTSPWAAADEAVKGWKEGGVKGGVFIYTGNIMAKAVFPHPDFTTLGTAKRAASYLVEAADAQYKAKGWR